MANDYTFKPKLINKHFLLLLLIWLILLMITIYWIEDIMFYTFFLGIILVGNLIVTPFFCYRLVGDILILKYFRKEIKIPLSQIRSMDITRAFYAMLFDKTIAIKVSPSFLNKIYPSRPVTAKWDFLIGKLSDDDMNFIINYVKKNNPGISQPAQEKKMPKEMHDKLKIIKKINMIGLIGLILSIITIIGFFIISQKFFPKFSPLTLPLISLLFGILMVIRGYLMRKLGLEYGPQIFTMTELFKERFIFKGKIYWMVQMIAGIVLIVFTLLLSLLFLLIY